MGRWLTQDPLGFVDGPNTFAYVGNSPVNNVDPYGLASCTYSITEHTLVCTPNDGGPSVTLGPKNVWSGAQASPCQDNPDCQGIWNFGPIPVDYFKMTPDTRPKHEHFWDLTREHPDLFRYEGFMLHPGTNSIGCITAERNDPNAMKQYSAVDAVLMKDYQAGGGNVLKVTE